MPIIVPHRLPAIGTLREEGISLYTAAPQGVTPKRVLLLNLMPKKAETEEDFLRVLADTPHWIELIPLKIKGQTYKNTPMTHMNAFYRDFDDVMQEHFEGLIVTGAPIENIPYEEVRYWQPLTAIFTWARTHVRSTLYICWAAQAGLYFHHDIPRYGLDAKKFGVFEQQLPPDDCPLFAGIVPPFFMPHSRHTEIRATDMANVAELCVVAHSPETDASIILTQGNRDVYVTGHLEYKPLTLDDEYRRDLSKGLPILPPQHYYVNDDPQLGVDDKWRANAKRFFENWLTHYALKA